MNEGFRKYRPFQPVKLPDRQWPDRVIEHAPTWCSVDLRDGNQALVNPMNLEQKLRFFQTLVKIGFKEIEVGFPSASETEYEILRALIDRNLIPDDVTIQVLVQARPHLIQKTFEAIRGAKNVIIHFYNSTSTLQRKVVFRTDMDGVIKIAVDAAKLIKKLTDEEVAKTGANIRFEYSPESFSGTEVENSVEICQRVLEELGATPEKKVILNLPNTVEGSTPNCHADQIEYFCRNLKGRDSAIVSLHPHNDRGCAVAATELGLLAGADRVEGTLFGNGERTGNADIMVVAMNMYSQGIDPELDFSNINALREIYEECTELKVHERHPYAGELVFTAFSGSHQDAIKKGVEYMTESHSDYWEVPYLPLDPADVGRAYEPIIRINSQSGKGGVAYVLKQNYGLEIPDRMREEVGYLMKGVSDHAHAELSPEDMLRVFEETYSQPKRSFAITEVHFQQKDGITTQVTFEQDGKKEVVEAKGNGRLNAVNNAIKDFLGISYVLDVYEEHALSKTSSSKAMAYVGITQDEKQLYWGVSSDEDIIRASIDALEHAVNHMIEIKGEKVH